MKFLPKLSLKLKQMAGVWLCLCCGLLLGALGVAVFQLMIGPLPISRSNETEVLLIFAGITLFLFIASFLGAAGLSAWLQRLIARPMLDLMRTADSVSRGKPKSAAVRYSDND